MSNKGKCRVHKADTFASAPLLTYVHPNPGPALRPHRRHPQATSLVTAAWKVHPLLEKNTSHVRPTAVVSRELDRYNIYIAALSETGVLGESRIDEARTGYTFFFKRESSW